MEGFYSHETTGLAFSPNMRFMYVCFQQDAFIFAISRLDGLAFSAKHLDMKRYANEVGSRKERR